MFRILLAFLIMLTSVAHATEVGRLKLDHPPLGTAGGPSLYTSINNIYTKISDNADSRYYTHSAIANSTTVTEDHNFGVAFDQMKVLIYTGTHPNLTRVTNPTAAGWVIDATVGFTTTKIDVTTPSSGGPHTFAVVIVNTNEYLDELVDVDVSTTAPEDGQALVYNSGSTTWVPGASGDSSFKCQSVSTPNVSLKSGYIITKGGTEYQLATDTSISLTTVLGTSPANATAYYLYLDTNAAPAATTLTNGRKVKVISTASHFFLSTLTPDAIYQVRYIPLCVIKSATTGNVWSGTGSAFATLATRRHNESPMGYGTGEINVVTSPYDAVNWAAGANMAVATTTTTSELPLGTSASGAIAQTVPSAIKITRTSGTNSAYIRWTMPAALKGRKLKVQWEQKPLSGYVSGDLKVQVRYNSLSDYTGSYTALGLSTDTAGVSSIPNSTGRFTTTFDADSTQDYYELDITGVSGTTALVISNVVVGPGIQAQGAVVGNWTSFTPTGSWSTNTTYTGFYRRVGSDMLINYRVATSGAPTAANLTLNMPTGFTIDTNALADTTANFGALLSTGIANDSSTTAYRIHGKYNSTSAIAVAYANTAGSATAAVSNTGPFTFGSGDFVNVFVQVPVAEWAGSGTVNIQQNDVEYAYNTSAADANDTTSFAYGPVGTLVPTIAASATTASRDKRVRFQTPIQPNDLIIFESQQQGVGSWLPLGSDISYQAFTAYGAAFIGIGLTYVNATDVDVNFHRGGRISNGATYAAAGASYPRNAADRWRLKKVSGGLPVGFSKADPTNLGLVSSYAPSIKSAVRTFTNAGYTITEFDGYDTLLCDSSAGIATVTLPSVGSSAGRILTIKKNVSASNSCVIDTPGAETIDGSNQNHLYAQYSFVTLKGDGTNWHVIDVWDAVSNSSTGQSISGSGVINNALNVTIGEGVWDVSGTIQLISTGTFTGVTILEAGFTTTGTNTYDSTTSGGYLRVPNISGITGANSTMSLSIPVRSITRTATLVTYFNEMLTYTTITGTFNLSMQAVRTR